MRLLSPACNCCPREDPQPEPGGREDNEDSEEEAAGPSFSTTPEPCSCGNCVDMGSVRENVCCKAETAWQAKFDPEGLIMHLEVLESY